ncbi:MAG TPA: OmpA family protein [Steroidobacteraceae bacterium]|jgi:outer membrane protein OmpA-like peptidoglycan-associated protein|nr:OmpA family protein [Steroidobacteraceae bacterium]
MQSVAVAHPHALVWRDTPVWPFVWRGLLPLVVLAWVAAFALGPVVHEWIEGTAGREIRSQLLAAGFGWVSVSVSGQSVALSGEEPAAGAGARALTLAQATTCPSWIGRFACATSISARFTAPAPLAARPAAGAPSAVQACDRSLAASLAGEQIEFASASATIAPASGALIDRLASEVRACPGIVRIDGHTDTIGRGAFNRRLSEARAAAVRDALIARGVPAEKLRTRGYGARWPVADNHSESGRARNRRIEFHAVSGN